MVQRGKQAAIEAEIDRIWSLGLDALRERWRLTFGRQPPAGLTKHLLSRILVYRIQERTFGGLGREPTKLLDRLARGEKPNELNRRLKPGTVLVREYQGERHTVTVVPDCFIWRGSSYPSLSTVAREITGTHWNGPRFFGLRERRKPKSNADKSPARPASKDSKRSKMLRGEPEEARR
jgi:hypothetical protein